MRTLYLVLLIAIAAIIGGALGYTFGFNRYLNLQEDIVSNESRLIESAKSITPDCQRILPHLSDTIDEHIFVVFLPIESQSGTLEKVIIDRTGHSAFETIKLNCEQ